MITTYTAVFDDYDTLLPARYPSLCFTDVPGSVWNWEYRSIFPDENPQWANRHCKILVHEHLDTEYSIYHDGNIRMLVDPCEAVRRWLGSADIAVFAHPGRNCIYDEALACINLRKANPKAVKAQMDRYRREDYPEGNGLAACWVLIRRHTEAVKRFNEAWWVEYSRGAKRDQLSFNYVCWKLGMHYNVIPGDLHKGTSHDFQRGPHKKKMRVDWKTASGLVLPLAEREWLRNTAEKVQTEFHRPTIVNIGVYRCASMYCLRAGAPHAELIGVDIEPCDVKVDPALQARFIIADSAQCHSEVAPPVHLLFIDGDHRYGAVKADLEKWTPKIPPGGIVALHDYAPLTRYLVKIPELEGVRRAVNEWAEKTRWKRLLAPDSLAAFRRPR